MLCKEILERKTHEKQKLTQRCANTRGGIRLVDPRITRGGQKEIRISRPRKRVRLTRIIVWQGGEFTPSNKKESSHVNAKLSYKVGV